MDTHVVLRAAMHLRMEDLTRWRTVDTATKKAFDTEGEENAWRYCALAQFTCHKLFASYSLYASSQRQLCFKFHALLQRVNYMISSDPLLVEDTEEAALIERRLRMAFDDCSAHRVASGRDAQVLMGTICLRGEKKTMFQFGRDGMAPTIAGLPPGVLAVKMCLQKDVVMTWAVYGEVRGNVFKSCQEAARTQLTFNISTAEFDVSVALRGIPLVLDGRWRSWKCSTRQCKCSATYGKWPALSVFSLFDAAPYGAGPSLVNALSLEPR
eukprot:TRINITY_DN10238_c2_g1_i1.p1 TRINITY_DN10238_c2_g1~~TRINITY_DN10238_c2_g1_i1.p1  ORF type:complete len:268 (+),score=37.52 TRINITY_DN10238_c2_g1_i1:60-863(+)